LIAGRVRRVLQTLQRLIHAEAAGLLTGREFLKGSQKLPDVLLRWHQNEGVIDPPPPVIDAFVVGGLERIGAQVEKFWETKWHEWVLPHFQAVRALFGEDDLVLVVA